jgi:hypothetical protein
VDSGRKRSGVDQLHGRCGRDSAAMGGGGREARRARTAAVCSGGGAGTAIGMERKGPGGDVFPFQGVGDELLGESCGLSMSEQPTDDVAAIDVENHVEMGAGPFGRALQFGDTPGPHFVGPHRQELGLGVERMNSLTAALATLVLARHDDERLVEAM